MNAQQTTVRRPTDSPALVNIALSIRTTKERAMHGQVPCTRQSLCVRIPEMGKVVWHVRLSKGRPISEDGRTKTGMPSTILCQISVKCYGWPTIAGRCKTVKIAWRGGGTNKNSHATHRHRLHIYQSNRAMPCHNYAHLFLTIHRL